VDANRFKEAYARLEVLDDRLTYRVRSRSVKARSAPTIEQLDERLRDVAEMLLEVKDVVRELMLAIASKPQAAKGEPPAP
jgi:hypothetical protein